MSQARGFGRSRVLLAVWGCVLLVSPAQADERIIRFGLTGDYPPFAERQPDGTFAGADVGMARKVARDMGARAQFVETSWASLAGDFAAGRFDVAIGGLSVDADRARLGTFSVALLEDGKRPLARCRDKARYRSIEAIDSPGVRVQINRGPAIAAFARQWFRRATVITNPDDATLIPALLSGQADVWITDGVVVDHMARRHPGRLCATTARPFTHVTKAWLVRGDPAFVAQINRGIMRAKRDGSWLRALRAVR